MCWNRIGSELDVICFIKTLSESFIVDSIGLCVSDNIRLTAGHFDSRASVLIYAEHGCRHKRGACWRGEVWERR